MPGLRQIRSQCRSESIVGSISRLAFPSSPCSQWLFWPHVVCPVLPVTSVQGLVPVTGPAFAGAHSADLCASRRLMKPGHHRHPRATRHASTAHKFWPLRPLSFALPPRAGRPAPQNPVPVAPVVECECSAHAASPYMFFAASPHRSVSPNPVISTSSSAARIRRTVPISTRVVS